MSQTNDLDRIRLHTINRIAMAEGAESHDNGREVIIKGRDDQHTAAIVDSIAVDLGKIGVAYLRDGSVAVKIRKVA